MRSVEESSQRESIVSAVIPVILSGGAGTRLWPLSREMYPKQLLALTGKQTMLQDTAARLATITGAVAPIVVCNEAHRFTVAEQLRAMEMPASAILLEPSGRNTAPAGALAAPNALDNHAHPLLLGEPAGRSTALALARAALKALDIDADATLIVAPANHVVRNVRKFSGAEDT